VTNLHENVCCLNAYISADWCIVKNRKKLISVVNSDGWNDDLALKIEVSITLLSMAIQDQSIFNKYTAFILKSIFGRNRF